MTLVVNVAAAVIEKPDGSFLLAQRPVGKIYAGHWEFPGGKAEMGETIADALHRELREELGIEVDYAYPWITRIHAYSHATVRLHFLRVVRWRGEPHPNEGQALTWQFNRQLTVAPMLPANAPVLKALSLPTQLGITHAWESGSRAALRQLRLALSRGLRLVQIREKALEPSMRDSFARQVVQEVAKFGGLVLINGDSRLASALGTGLHLTASELMVAQTRPAIEWCSASCHNVAELQKAAAIGLDFVLLGPVLATPTHAGVSGIGWDKFAELVRDYPLPVFAVGGMHPDFLDKARRQGAHGLAMVRGMWAPKLLQGSSSSG